MAQAPASETGSHPEIIDPRWMLKALGIVVLVAALCGYITLCGLFVHGQWQLALSPSRTVAKTPSDFGLGFSPVRFGPDASGQPQLDGWWIPADLTSDPTVLMLHSGSGSISDALTQAKSLHETRLSVLLFDYRGFGRSGGQHPSQELMEQDADAALKFLTDSRHISAKNILVYGSGVGASLAARLCEQHHDLPALILDNADGDLETRVRDDSRARMIPVSLLFHERFPLKDTLASLRTPKLLLSITAAKTPPAIYKQAADPKMTVELPAQANDSATHDAIRRFLDTYVSRPAPGLMPSP